MSREGHDVMGGRVVRLRWLGVWFLVGLAVGCGSDEQAGGAAGGPACSDDFDCAVGERCEDGACEDGGGDTTTMTTGGTTATSAGITAQTSATTGGTTGGMTGATSTSNGTAATSNGTADAGMTGGEDGGCAPAEEVCNGEDDDCDGQVDEGTAQNACGGCDTLQQQPGEPCSACGVWTCLGANSLSCQGPQARNACGGCAVLEQQPGMTCGACGTVECDGEDGVVCNDPGEEACRPVRLIAMGDTGEGNANQYRVAAGVQRRCDLLGGCDGFLMLGDNIYDTGAESADDRQFDEKIDLPYADLKMGPPPAEGEPDNRERMVIYVTLGNHDLGGAGLNSWQVINYIDYGRDRDWFYFPDEFWDAQVGNVHLMSLHTNPMAYLGDQLDAQAAMVEQALQRTTAQWTIAFGHHPYLSEGRHGNAGSYEGVPGDLFFLGGRFREWVDDTICNRVDFYLSGHDHNRQWIEDVPLIPTWPLGLPESDRRPCRTEFAVSGAGAKTTDFEDRGNTLAFGSEELGFMLMEFEQDHARVEFCDADGNPEWERVIMR